MGIAAGAWLAGKKPVLVMQNSGFFESLSAMASLLVPMNAAVPVIVSARGSFGVQDEPHHDLVGRSFLKVAGHVGFPVDVLQKADVDLCSKLDRLWSESAKRGVPSLLVVLGDTFAEDDPMSDAMRPDAAPLVRGATRQPYEGPAHRSCRSFSRLDAIDVVLQNIEPHTIVVAGVGYVGRELFAAGDRDRNLYLAGAMGCASAVALGLGIFSSAPVVVFDGDGAALMRLGNLATIGSEHPSRLAHIVFNNGQYESTGGQQRVGQHVQFCAIASACGYATCLRPNELSALGTAISGLGGSTCGSPLFADVVVGPSATKFPRPAVSLKSRAEALRQILA